VAYLSLLSSVLMVLLNVLTMVNSCCSSVSSPENSFKSSIQNKWLTLYFPFTSYPVPYLSIMLFNGISAKHINLVIIIIIIICANVHQKCSYVVPFHSGWPRDWCIFTLFILKMNIKFRNIIWFLKRPLSKTLPVILFRKWCSIIHFTE